MLNRFWQWTSAPAQGQAETSIPHGPLRFHPWTSAEQADASVIPHGPLRFHPWTSGSGIAPSTVIPHGPFRFRPWTSGPETEPPEEPPVPVFVGGVPFYLPPDQSRRARILREDEEIMAVIIAWLHTSRTLQ